LVSGKVLLGHGNIDTMRFQVSGNHLFKGILAILGFFAVLMTAAIIPQSASSQFASLTGMNQSVSPGINIPLNDSSTVAGEGFTKDCLYKGELYSPGSVVPMPGGNKECQNNGTWL
jgi:hypothetical protein